MWYQQEDDMIIMNVYVQPGAKRTECVGFYGDVPKIRLASPPIDGRANDALLNFISQVCDVPKRQVVLMRGDKSRHKQLVITGSRIEPLSLVVQQHEQ